jgi:hypothetical protein
VFTVGNTGAGWYQFSTQVLGVTNSNGETIFGVAYFLDINNSGTPTCISTYDQYNNGTAAGLRNSSKINCLIYLEAGNNVRFKGQSWASNAGTYTSTNGTTFVNIVRIK